MYSVSQEVLILSQKYFLTASVNSQGPKNDYNNRKL